MSNDDQRDLVDGEKGLHRDGAKPRLSDIFHWSLLLDAGAVWALNGQPTDEYPEGKYPDIDGKPNYQSGIQTTKILDSCQRHLTALHQGRDTDRESGLDHAAHLLCCLSMFSWMREHRPDMDNRSKPAKGPNPAKVSGGGYWKCGYCGGQVHPYRSQCLMCLTRRPGQ